MNPTTTTAPRKARVLRIWFEITDAHGQTSPYSVKPVPPWNGDYIAAYTITRYSADRQTPENTYVCNLTFDGADCSCPAGRQHQPCKHRACLSAAGMFAIHQLVALRKLSLEMGKHRPICDPDAPPPFDWEETPSTPDESVANSWGG
jgi:hypothetical protein